MRETPYKEEMIFGPRPQWLPTINITMAQKPYQMGDWLEDTNGSRWYVFFADGKISRIVNSTGGTYCLSDGFSTRYRIIPNCTGWNYVEKIKPSASHIGQIVWVSDNDKDWHSRKLLFIQDGYWAQGESPSRARKWKSACVNKPQS